MTFTTCKNRNGSITLETIIDNQLEKQTYYGYTIPEAKARFKVFISNLIDNKKSN